MNFKTELKKQIELNEIKSRPVQPKIGEMEWLAIQSFNKSFDRIFMENKKS